MIKIEFYFDVETEGLNPETDKIITLQYQQLDREGNPAGDLIILKEWELTEEELIKHFLSIFKKWEFIPVGMNLSFDFKFLLNKIKKYTGKQIEFYEFSNIPHLDIKSILVMMNNGNFSGASLTNFTNKKQRGSIIPFYYSNRDYDKIIKYIEVEATEFIKFYSNVKSHLKKLVLTEKNS